MLLPEPYYSHFKQALFGKAHPSFMQIATVAKEEESFFPKVRTVLCYDLDLIGGMGFSCSKKTEKWEQLENNPQVCGLYLDSDTWTQYRFEATAKLLDESDEQYVLMWQHLRADIRSFRWQEYYRLENKTGDIDVEKICPYHGCVLLEPYHWDIFHLGISNFSDGERTILDFKNNQWQLEEKASLMHPGK
jgi:hypothetical protein